MKNRLEYACAVVGLVTIVLGVAPKWSLELSSEVVQSEYEPAYIALELATSPRDFVTRIGAEQMTCSHLRPTVKWDYAFILSYVAWFGLVGNFVFRRAPRIGRLSFRWIAFVMILGGALIAGALNVHENLVLDAFLATRGGRVPYLSALAKWGALFVAMAGVIPVFSARATLFRRLIGYTAGIFCALTGIVGFGGLLLDEEAMVARASAYFLWAGIFTSLYFASAGLLRDGLVQALDRLTMTRPFRGLARRKYLQSLLPRRFRTQVASCRPLLAIARWPNEDLADLDPEQAASPARTD